LDWTTIAVATASKDITGSRCVELHSFQQQHRDKIGAEHSTRIFAAMAEILHRFIEESLGIEDY
jgi:hypothetical protein